MEASKFESMEDIPWKRENPGFKFKTILTLFETASHQHRKTSSGKTDLFRAKLEKHCNDR